MNSNRKYRDERDFAYKRIENEEREFRSFIKLDDLIMNPIVLPDKYNQLFDIRGNASCQIGLASLLRSKESNIYKDVVITLQVGTYQADGLLGYHVA